MPSPDEANAILANLASLRQHGTHVVANLKLHRGEYLETGRPEFARWLLWVNEAMESVQAATTADGYVHKQAGVLMEEANRATEQGGIPEDQASRLTDRAGDLMDTAERTIRLATRLPFGDDFKRAVDIAIKDAYFESWAFRFAAVIFGLALAVVFGGAVYSTYQISGIQERSERAQQTIRDRSADFEKQLTAANKDIIDRTSHIDEIVNNAIVHNREDFAKVLNSAQSDLNTYVNGTKQKLDTEQIRVVAGMNTELRDHVQSALSQTTNEIQSEGARIEAVSRVNRGPR